MSLLFGFLIGKFSLSSFLSDRSGFAAVTNSNLWEGCWNILNTDGAEDKLQVLNTLSHPSKLKYSVRGYQS